MKGDIKKIEISTFDKPPYLKWSTEHAFEGEAEELSKICFRFLDAIYGAENVVGEASKLIELYTKEWLNKIKSDSSLNPEDRMRLTKLHSSHLP
eukprot:CAMPEP_0114601512 /NCGR_PEP_ID=MMETSP0125-20121206/24148_1 /TAXON_ID=485358 ORGANISM="Aristerostoma sp., Strain ATCC 50986" /NCGR_SAMPLE_ID=MMETSP0125 /ASSEMBLY_ACC=CAM_ASM_000245 /LENGTH=93 /DNA_ID=CAMNT_0001810849 /DNA_START=169 /DNA_END=450 /DNA_ORIENTATION=-